MSADGAAVRTTLRRATEAQVAAANDANHAAWGAPLSLARYRARNASLDALPFSLAEQVPWCLVPEGDPETTDVLSSCETYRRPCLYRMRGEEEVREGHVLAIASVFTPEQHRRKGYAAAMLSRLLREMRGMEGCVGSTLYSDIGPHYYARMGWVPHSVTTTVLDLSAAPLAPWLDEALTSSTEAAGVTILDADGVRAEALRDAEQARERLLAAGGDEGTRVAIVATPEGHEWTYGRAAFFSRELRGQEPPRERGAVVRGEDGAEGLIFWAPNFPEGHLEVTLVRFPPGDVTKARALLCSAGREARRRGLKSVKAWGGELGETAGVGGGVRVEEREDSIPSLCFWGGREEEEMSVRWVCSEKCLWV